MPNTYKYLLIIVVVADVARGLGLKHLSTPSSFSAREGAQILFNRCLVNLSVVVVSGVEGHTDSQRNPHRDSLGGADRKRGVKIIVYPGSMTVTQRKPHHLPDEIQSKAHYLSDVLDATDITSLLFQP
jgi:hypothetical protein